MTGKFPLRYDATQVLILVGDQVVVPLSDGKTAVGVVRHVSARTRKVEVWISRRAVSHGPARRRLVCRRDVSPLPWLRRRNWPPQAKKVVA